MGTINASEVAKSFLPPWLRHELVAATTGLPRSRDAAGAALWVDLVNFTSLVEDFVSAGPAGAETLSELLDTYFGRLLDVVRAHGGEVAALVGDAALVLFSAGDETDLRPSWAAASNCALALDDALAAQVFVGGRRLTHRVSVASGSLHFLQLGGPGHAFALVTGRAVEGLGALHRAALPGQILTMPVGVDAAPTLLVGNASPRPVAHVAQSDDPAPLPIETAVPYLPAAVVARVIAGHSEWLAELRVVSALFVLLPPTNDGASTAHLQRIVARVLEVIARFDGCPYQLVLDDKGLTLIGVWGLASQSHDDDATRAVRAGLAILDALEGLDVAASAGVSSGKVFCGVYGSARQRHFICLGSVMNLAARLMSMADGALLCDAETARRPGTRVVYEPRGRARVKGLAEAVEVYRARPGATMDSSPPEGPSRVVGRASQRAALTEAIARLARGVGGLVRVTAEPGMGKTTLLLTFLRDAGRRGIRTLFGAGDPVEQQAALLPWQSVFGALLADLHGDTSAARERLESLLSNDPDLLRFLSLLQVCVPLGLEETAETRELPAVGRMDRLQELVTTIVARAAAERPTALVFDDVHWMDSLSCTLVRAVLDRAPGVLLVIASRPPEPTASPELLQLLSPRESARDLILDSLSPEAMAEIIARTLGVEVAPPTLVQLVAERSEGHPMHTEEITQALLDRGLVTVRDGVALMHGSVTDVLQALPDSLQRVLTSRIDGLASMEQLVVKVASVVGRRFQVETLRRVFPVSADLPRLGDALESLCARRLLERETPPRVGFVFRHALTQQAAYETLLFAQRRQLHRAAADALEAAPDDHPSPRALAHHWTQAGEPSRAAPYLESAAREAAENFANREAVTLYEELLRDAAVRVGLVSNDRRADWESARCEAYIKLGDRERSVEALERSLALRGIKPPRSVLATAWQIGRQVLRQAVQRLVPGRYFGRDPDRRAHWAKVAFAMQSSTELAWHRQDLARMAWSTWTGVNLGELGGESPGVAMLYASCCVSVGLAGLQRPARWYYRRAMEIAARADEGVRAYVNVGCGIYDNAVGRWLEADALWSWASQYYERVGDRYRAIEGRAAVMFQEQQLGGFERVVRLGEEIDRLASFEGGVLGRVQGRSARASALLMLGRASAECAAHIEEALADDPPAREHLIGSATLARIWLATGDLERAALWAERAVTAGTRNPPLVYFVAPSIAQLIEVCCALGLSTSGSERERWSRHARSATKLLESLHWTVKTVTPAWQIGEGQCALLAGSVQSAERCLARAGRVARRYQMPYDERRAAEVLRQGLAAR